MRSWSTTETMAIGTFVRRAAIAVMRSKASSAVVRLAHRLHIPPRTIDVLDQGEVLSMARGQSQPRRAVRKAARLRHRLIGSGGIPGGTSGSVGFGGSGIGSAGFGGISGGCGGGIGSGIPAETSDHRDRSAVRRPFTGASRRMSIQEPHSSQCVMARWWLPHTGE